jgi:hypothetical protein
VTRRARRQNGQSLSFSASSIRHRAGRFRQIRVRPTTIRAHGAAYEPVTPPNGHTDARYGVTEALSAGTLAHPGAQSAVARSSSTMTAVSLAGVELRSCRSSCPRPVHASAATVVHVPRRLRACRAPRAGSRLPARRPPVDRPAGSTTRRRGPRERPPRERAQSRRYPQIRELHQRAAKRLGS